MDNNRIKRNEVLAEGLIRSLKARNMTGYYAANKEEAKQIALSLIPENATVTHGGSMTIGEIGLEEELKSGRYRYCDRAAAANKRDAELFAYDADVYLGSVNAISKDGVLINIDGNANRVSAYAFGPKKLILIVGLNKVASDVDSAIKRARNEASPINCIRLGLNSPCTKTGSCVDCLTPDTICCQFLITRYSKHADRIHVILVNEDLGY